METTQTYVGLPRLNEKAPDLKVQTTHGPRSRDDYQGKYLVLFSHPAVFTPVCTTEFIAFAQRHEELTALNADVLGLSIDSIFSHLARVDTIKEKFGDEIPFPIIEDLSMNWKKGDKVIVPQPKTQAEAKTRKTEGYECVDWFFCKKEL